MAFAMPAGSTEKSPAIRRAFSFRAPSRHIADIRYSLRAAN
jgi:hypothetical protein